MVDCRAFQVLRELRGGLCFQPDIGRSQSWSLRGGWPKWCNLKASVVALGIRNCRHVRGKPVCLGPMCAKTCTMDEKWSAVPGMEGGCTLPGIRLRFWQLVAPTPSALSDALQSLRTIRLSRPSFSHALADYRGAANPRHFTKLSMKPRPSMRRCAGELKYA